MGVSPAEPRHCGEIKISARSAPGQPKQFLSALSQISPHFRPRRHLLTATDYRTEMLIRFAIWDRITGTTALPTAA